MNFSTSGLDALMTLNWNAAPARRDPISSTPTPSSTRSRKPTKFDTAVPAGQNPWTVELHREVAKDVARYGLRDIRFTPSLRELIDALAANPKQFEKKKGKLKAARAADLQFKNVTFRAVFILDEAARTVSILSLDPHDEAYRNAKRRFQN